MPMLANPRHERFAQELAVGRTADEAYVIAGYKRDRHHGARLATKGHIRERIAELHGRAAEGVVITRQRVLEELASLAFAEIGHPHVRASDKRSALRDIAQLNGWLVEKREVGGPGDFARMTDEELEIFIARHVAVH